MGRGGVARDGSGRAALARIFLRPAAGGLRGRLPARGGRVLLRLPTLRLARDVLSGRRARAADHLHPHQGPGVRGMATHAPGHVADSPRDSRQLEIVPIPVRADDDDEFRLARHAGHVPDLPRKDPRLRHPHRRDHRAHIQCRRAARRPDLRLPVRSLGPTAHDGDGGDLRRSRHPAVDLSLDARGADDGRVRDAVHGAGRMGRHSGASDRALAAGSSRAVLGTCVSDRRLDGLWSRRQPSCPRRAIRLRGDARERRRNSNDPGRHGHPARPPTHGPRPPLSRGVSRPMDAPQLESKPPSASRRLVARLAQLPIISPIARRLRSRLSDTKFVTFPLGAHGQLGNQLFQIAATIGVARRSSCSFVFPPWPYARHFEFPIPQARFIREFERRMPSTWAYEEITVDRTTELWGYFQSERFFAHCQDEVRHYFTPHHALAQMLDRQFGDLMGARTCSVHVRRTHYLGDSAWPDLAKGDYYERAMSQFDPATTFVMFSDDLEWCK